MKYDKIWYATPQRARSRTKWIVYDDVGTLAIENSQISFQGTRTRVEPTKIESLVLTRQSANIVSYFIMCLLVLPLFMLFAYIANIMFAFPIVIVLLSCYSIVAVGLILGLSTKWIRVTFYSESGEPEEVFFADGGTQGWRGILGGTRRIFNEIRNNISVAAT